MEESRQIEEKQKQTRKIKIKINRKVTKEINEEKIDKIDKKEKTEKTEKTDKKNIKIKEDTLDKTGKEETKEKTDKEEKKEKKEKIEEKTDKKEKKEKKEKIEDKKQIENKNQIEDNKEINDNEKSEPKNEISQDVSIAKKTRKTRSKKLSDAILENVVLKPLKNKRVSKKMDKNNKNTTLTNYNNNQLEIEEYDLDDENNNCENQLNQKRTKKNTNKRLKIPYLHIEAQKNINQINKEALVEDIYEGFRIYYDPVKNIIYDKQYVDIGYIDDDGIFTFYNNIINEKIKNRKKMDDIENEIDIEELDIQDYLDDKNIEEDDLCLDNEEDMDLDNIDNENIINENNDNDCDNTII